MSKIRLLFTALHQRLKSIQTPLPCRRVWGWVFLLFFFTSCNLFIEDEVPADDYGFTDIPEYSGEGYDTPVTTNGNGCEVTYQLKKTVRQLTTDDCRYITYVKQDNSGLFMEIHFSPQTPRDLLPVKGQILVSTDVNTFPMGCMHRVQAAEQRDGEYCYLATLADLQETFEELDISGQLSSTETEEISVAPEEDTTAVADARATRAGRSASGAHRSPKDNNNLKVTTNETGFSFYYEFDNEPIVTATSKTLENLDMDIHFKEGSLYRQTHTFNFDDFSLSRRSFKIVYERVDELDMRLHLGVAYKAPKHLHTFRPIKGKPFTIGPVVFVLFVNVDFTLELDLNATNDVRRHVINRNTTYIDLLSTQAPKRVETTDLDTGWYCDGMIDGKAGLRITVELCLGIYGKILSLRIAPSVFLGFEAVIAKSNAPEGEIPMYNLEKKPGLTPKFEWQLELGVYFELSFLDFFSELFDRLTSSNVGTALDKVADEAAKGSAWYKEHSAKNEWTDADLERFQRKTDDKSSISTTFGPWNIVKMDTRPWYPSVDDEMFQLLQYYDNLTKELCVGVHYIIDHQGFFATFSDYIPAIAIMYGKHLEQIVYPDGEGRRARVEEDKMFHFTLPLTDDEKERTACPCYIKADDPTATPVAIDKGKPFVATTPHVGIVDVKGTRGEWKEGDFYVSYYNEDEDQFDLIRYNYEYTFYYTVVLSRKGYQHMLRWGFIEVSYMTTHTFGEGDYKNVDGRDGTYTFNCYIKLYSEKFIDNPGVTIRVAPYFQLKDEFGFEAISPEATKVWVQDLDGNMTFINSN